MGLKRSFIKRKDKLARSIAKRKNKIVQSLFSLLGREPISPFGHQVLQLLGREALRPCTASSVALRSLDLVKPSVSTVAQPVWVGAMPVVMHGSYSKIRAHLLGGAEVIADVSGIVLPGHLVVSEATLADRPRIIIQTEGFFEFKPHHCHKIKTSYATEPRGILVSGAGASNWYHFMIEILPKALLAQSLPAEFAEYPLMVPQECYNLPSFAQALAVFANGRRTIVLAKGQPLHVEKLIAFDDVSLCPYNLIDSDWPVRADFGQHDDLLLHYFQLVRANVLGSAKSATTAPQRRIFLTRPMVRRNYNQDELVSIAQKYGFEACEPGGLTLDEQAKLFSTADMVIGASGAAWVGMIFRAAPAQFLSWLPAEYNQFCCYSNIAAIMGHQMEFLEYTPDHPLKSTGDAYGTGYYLDPEQFERALQRMTGVAGR